jgi:hypothetical protein
MSKVEVRTRIRRVKETAGGKRRWSGDVELVMEILLLPRGSGNRNMARALAQAAKKDRRLGPHVKRVKAGASKVWVTLVPSMALAHTMLEWNGDRPADVPGQLPLFGGACPA